MNDDCVCSLALAVWGLIQQRLEEKPTIYRSRKEGENREIKRRNS